MGKTIIRPATRNRPCDACGAAYTYPEADSAATRFYCANCVAISDPVLKALKRLNTRLTKLEKSLAKLSATAQDKKIPGSTTTESGQSPEAV